MGNISKIIATTFLGIAIAISGCNNGGDGGNGDNGGNGGAGAGAGAAGKAGARVVHVSFGGTWSAAQRAAVVRGMNKSEGSKRYGVRFSEYKGGGSNHRGVRVQWFDRAVDRQLVAGMCVAGFWMGKGFNLMSISDSFVFDLGTIERIAKHEAEHAFGRLHLAPADRKRLERQYGRIPESMDWQPWPDKPAI